MRTHRRNQTQTLLQDPEEKLRERYQIYRDCADDGHGNDITAPGKPLLTFDQWLNT